MANFAEIPDFDMEVSTSEHRIELGGCSSKPCLIIGWQLLMWLILMVNHTIFMVLWLLFMVTINISG